MRKAVAVLRMLMVNPINRKNRIAALIRFFKWQLGSWLVPGKVLIPWINESRIFAGFMMSGSAGCAYSGLHEFEEMAFTLHFLRKEDLFMDVGANVGLFTVLAGSAVGSSCISVEPGTDAYAHLLDNIQINRMRERVQTINACVSDEDSTCLFSTSPESTLSHIASSEEEGNAKEMKTMRIDSILSNTVPSLLKIDVEGFEKQAIEGASRTLQDKRLKAMLVELGEHSLRYGIAPYEIHETIMGYGFKPYAYDPFTRSLKYLDSYSASTNTLYIRDKGLVEARLKDAEPFEVFGMEI